ncbi:uncharacterized protein LOC119103924 isoform X2 [Pollicipes pollicipes]|uniref:uncharacterized protein LOC119103924 isoform X2 n=1 Tax=Pollicipes pollicipes TaxID=41117 RepID=UPI001885A09D|nr:uncharacterized protein LOC119103924 isoform X2 [Pollicipes pollicipes]
MLSKLSMHREGEGQHQTYRKSTSEQLEMSGKFLEERVFGLEDKVFGDLDKNDQYTKATDVILGFNNRLGNVLGDYERAVMIMKRLDELESYLDPLYGEQLTTTPASRAAELLGTQAQIRQLAQQLEAVQQLLPLLDSEHIKGAGDLRQRLQAVSECHLAQTERLARLQARSQQLACAYSQVVSTLAGTLVQLEHQVSRAELAAK